MDNKDKIKQIVRKNYGNLATSNQKNTAAQSPNSCCSVDILPSPGNQCCCSPNDKNVESISTLLGYSKADMQNIPEGANLGLGCGNPIALASLKAGETVVDLGSGAGFDCFIAARKVGETGCVIGVDMTPEMVGKARENAVKSGSTNVEFRLGEIEHLPVDADTADVIMSNCVINLSPNKLEVYKDAFRVLKPGGRIAISDVVVTAQIPIEIKNNPDLICGCIGGAITAGEVKKMLEESGFEHIKITVNKESKDFINTWAPEIKPENFVASAFIEAMKPVENKTGK